MKYRALIRHLLPLLSLTLLSVATACAEPESERVRAVFETVDSVLQPQADQGEERQAMPERPEASSPTPGRIPRALPRQAPSRAPQPAPRPAALAPAPPPVRTLPVPLQREATRAISQKITEGKFHALVVGINDYKYINKLENAVNDAQVVAQVLKEEYGFETTVLLEEQATRDNIMRALNEMRKKLAAEDSFLIYYSGHGEFNKDTGTSYWLPVDAHYDDTTNWLEARSVSDQLKLLAARHVLIVADSCFSGTMTRSADSSLRGNTTRENYLNKLFEKPSRVLIASGGNEPVSDGGAQGHSLFASVFINALQNPFDRIFTAEELMARQLKESVAGRTEQTPEYRVIRNSGHDGGDFLFVKKSN